MPAKTGGGRRVRKGAKISEMAEMRKTDARERTDTEHHADSLRDGAGFLGGDLDHDERSVCAKVYERWCAGSSEMRSLFQTPLPRQRVLFGACRVGRIERVPGSSNPRPTIEKRIFDEFSMESNRTPESGFGQLTVGLAQAAFFHSALPERL